MSFVNKAKNIAKGLKEKPIYLYTQEESEHFEGYIKRNFGEFTKVFHELYSPDVHVDILIIPPSEKSNYYKLITMGAGAYKMNVPDEIKEYDLDRAEFVAFLPPDWDMNEKNSKYNWVLGELQNLGRISIHENGWVGFGHTICNEGNIPVSKHANFSSVILLSAEVETEGYSIDLKLPNKGTINFYQVFPLYKEEVDYIKNNGIESFPKIIPDPENFIPIIDIDRKNYCEGMVLNKEEEIEEEIEK